VVLWRRVRRSTLERISIKKVVVRDISFFSSPKVITIGDSVPLSYRCKVYACLGYRGKCV